METWTRSLTGDAIVEHQDDDTGEIVQLHVPWEHRHTSLGWGRRRRAKWKHVDGEERQAVVVSEGHHGVLARDEEGNLHALPHGSYEPLDFIEPKPDKPMRKAVLVDLMKGADIPAGARWITVRPNGPGTEGHPLLIQPHPDGGFRVIGGAGGKLNHLRLRHVAGEEELRERGKAKAKERAGAERDRRKALTPDERAAEDREKQAKQERVKKAERKVIETTRSKWGGVDEDLDEEATKGLSEAGKKKLVDQHHRKQFRQAMKARKDIATHLAKDRIEQIEDEVAVDAAIREEPDGFHEAQEVGQRELAMIEAEEEAREVARRPSNNRADSEERAKRATETADAALRSIDRDENLKELKELGGRSNGETPMLGDKASDEARRRAAQFVDDAIVLADAARGEQPTGDPDRANVEFQIITDALKQAGVEPGADEHTVREALANEARLRLERAELEHVKAKKWEALEAEGKGQRALKQLAKADVVRGLTREVRDAATKLGLREEDKTPLRQAEIAEMLDVLSSHEELRRAKEGLDKVVKEAEPPKYDRSRQAFDLHIEAPPQHVVEQVHEQVLRELAQRITGLADHKAPAHVQAVADGHYAQLADVALSVSNQNHLDRPTMDALGLKNSSILLRHALEQQGHKADDLHEALTSHHVKQQAVLTTEALRQADAFVPEIESTVHDVGDIEHAMKRLDASDADAAAAQRAIGAALGQMEANATMAQAMKGELPPHLTLELRDGGQGTIASHLTWLHSIGLQPGDFEVDQKAKEIRIPREKWGKLIRHDDPKVVEQRKAVHDLKRGEQDEQGWMPKGMVSRSSDSFNDPPTKAPRYHTGLDLNADDIHSALADHIGSRLADGERPSDISKDLLSPNIAGKAAAPEAFTELARGFFPLQTDEDKAQLQANAENRKKRQDLTDQYRAAKDAGNGDEVERLAGEIAKVPKDVEVQPKRDVHFKDHYEKLASDYMKKHHPDAAPLHARSLYDGADDKQVREAVFRALADEPHNVAAFTPIGELTPEHRKALQDHFYKRAGIADTRDYSKEFAERRKKLVEDIKSGKVESPDAAKAAEAQGQGGLFGGGASKPKAELTEDNLAELHPTLAKQLAYEYPREGHELFKQAMGPRPTDESGGDLQTGTPGQQSKLSPEVHKAVAALQKEQPRANAAQLAKLAASRLGRDRALKELGAKPEDLVERDKATGELTDKAKNLSAKLATRSGELGERGIDPREIERSFGPAMHDAEHAEFEAYRKKHATPWSSFVDYHGDLGTAYQALQEEMKGDFAERLSQQYGRITKTPLQTGLEEVPNADLHAQALATPAKRAELAEQRRAEIQASRQRAEKGAVDTATGKGTGGQYLTGSALERYRAAKDAERSNEQRQGGLFGSAPKAAGKVVSQEPGEKRAPKPGERLSLGSRVEQEVQSLLGGNIGKTMKPDTKVKPFPGASMDGRRVAQQRVIKQLRNVKRVGAWLGTGSGKTPTSIGAFTDLHATGDASHGLFLVPTAVQSQFGDEMLQFTEPGKFRFETGTGKSHAERAAMLRDKNVHMRVMTHQSATRTVLRLAAEHHGIAPEAMLDRLRGMNDGDRAKAIRAALDAHGIPKHYTYVDEAHGLTTRQGEQESDTSIVLGALTHPTNSTHALFGSATPHKNDTSEVYAMARLIDPDRYSDAYRFTQSYGQGSVAAPDAVRRELDANTYTDSIPPDGVNRYDIANPTLGPDGKKQPGGPIPLSDKHKAEVDKVTAAYEKANDAYRKGGVDVEATKTISPDRFKDADPSTHEQLAKDLAPSLGIVKETAIRKALQLAPIEHNEKLRRMTEVLDHDLKKGKQSIIFTDSAEEAHHLHKTLAAKGIAAGMYHGGMNEQERDKFRRDMKAGKLPVGIMTAAGEAGLNLQTTKVIHHYDVPKTAKSWSQRNGRAYRQGQKDDVEVHDWSHDHPFEAAAKRRLQDKARLADVFQTPLGPMDEHGFAREYFERLNKKHESFDIDSLPMAAK